MPDTTIEAEIQAKGLTAPRVTPARIEQVIASEYYFTAADALRFGWLTEDHADPDVREMRSRICDSLPVRSYSGACSDIDCNAPIPMTAKLLTICVLILENGFTVLGKSACASPENFDADVGKRVAREDAVRQIWPLEGYLLKQQLHEDALIEAERPVEISPGEQLSRDLTEAAREEALGG